MKHNIEIRDSEGYLIHQDKAENITLIQIVTEKETFTYGRPMEGDKITITKEITNNV